MEAGQSDIGTPDFDSPQAYEPVSGSGEVAVTEGGTKLENVALRAANNWTVSWSDLPKADSENAPYYYIVKETVTIPGYRTTYLNNGGIQTGIIYITNQKRGGNKYNHPPRNWWNRYLLVYHGRRAPNSRGSVPDI